MRKKNRTQVTIIKILLILLIFEFIILADAQINDNSKVFKIQHIPLTSNEKIISPIVSYITNFTEPTYPKPSYIPKLRPMDCYNKNDEIWHPCNPSSYIQPNNSWVQYYVKNNLPIEIIYRTDDDLYNYPPNGDMWQNADYTLYTGYGDCEDISIVQVSIDIAKGRKAMVIGGYITLDNGQRIRDFWEEIYSNGMKSIMSTNPSLETQTELRLEPVYMFNDKISWRSYDANWYYN